MQISAEKSKVMSMRSSDKLDASINGEKLETVTQFKYLSSITDDAKSVQELKIRIAVATASLPKLKVIWRARIDPSRQSRHLNASRALTF